MTTPPVHILGLGNIGLLLAHSLAQAHGAASITLLFHRASLLRSYQHAGSRISLASASRPGTVHVHQGFTTQVILPPQEDPSTPTPTPADPIHNLILATKAPQTLAALASIKHRLTPNSTILLAQNGLGLAEELVDKLYPDDHDPGLRPTFLAAVVTHGVYSPKPFHVVHAGRGTVSIGLLHGGPSPPPPQLAEMLCDSPSLGATYLPPAQLLQAQTEKLVVNAIINPLTVLFNCRNGQLFHPGNPSSTPAHALMDLLLHEIIQVLQPQATTPFSVPHTRTHVLSIAAATAANTSSMLQDFAAGRATEIGYINGYIVRKGAERGVDCSVNRRVVEIVRGGRFVGLEEVLGSFPELRGGGGRGGA